jgi:Protein of unknown function (DUF1592)/Protein of unknown function (DUF1588)/Protein of unknown function (DUF1595)/Protein of unknown function (DUF1587)/Protein of unknown function (DUF1585)
MRESFSRLMKVGRLLPAASQVAEAVKHARVVGRPSSRMFFAAGLASMVACSGKIGQPEGLGSGPATGTPGTTGSTGSGSGAGSGSGGQAASCMGALPLSKPRIWRLTGDQLANTLRDEFAFVPPSLNDLPIDERLDGFANQASKLTIAPLLAETYFAMGDELGAQAVATPSAFGISCSVASLAPGTCLNNFIASAGQKMWRRPLTPSEVSAYSTLFATTAAEGEGPPGGVKSVVQAMFMSPNFLHRTELGSVMTPGAVTPLTDYELASSLSYSLWNTAPDNELLALAGQGKLRDKTVLLAEAQRMFDASDKSAPAVNTFLQQWLYLENLSTDVKDPTLFPTATPDLTADLGEELRLFSNSVLFDPGADHSFKTLFTASYTFVNARTAPLYGLTGVTGDALVRRDLDPSQRLGVTSMVPFLWGHSNAEDTNLVGRGAYFRNEVLCDRVSLPPGGVPASAMFAPPNATGRQKLSVHASPACAGCHRLFDGIGFALEDYDPIGQFRTMDQGQMIDPTGNLPLPSEGDAAPGLAFANYTDMITQLAEKPDVYTCFATQYASYVAGRDIPELDSCEKAMVVEQFAKASYKIDQLTMTLVGLPTFTDRQN